VNKILPAIFSTAFFTLINFQSSFATPSNDELNRRLESLEKKYFPSSDNSIFVDSLTLYGSLRPTILAFDDGTDTSYDIGDALSRIGFKGSIDIADGLKGIFEGEWSIDISNNGDFGKARKVFVGISGIYGTVAIGKQRTPHYLLIAEPVDIFNHANSPFAYDNVGTFFVNNQVTYQYNRNGFRLLSSAQVNGSAGDDKTDMVNVGASYSIQQFYVAAAYLRNIAPATTDSLGEGDELTNIATTAAVTLGDFYIAGAYQKLDTETNADDIDGRTVDISGSMKLPNESKVKAGLFSYDDGLDTASNEHKGWNITFEKQFNSQFRGHIEYLAKDFKSSGKDNQNALTLGLRYDFERIID